MKPIILNRARLRLKVGAKVVFLNPPVHLRSCWRSVGLYFDCFFGFLSTTNVWVHNYLRKITSALDFQSKPWYNDYVSNRIAEGNYSLSELSKCRGIMLLALFY